MFQTKSLGHLITSTQDVFQPTHPPNPTPPLRIVPGGFATFPVRLEQLSPSKVGAVVGCGPEQSTKFKETFHPTVPLCQHRESKQHQVISKLRNCTVSMYYFDVDVPGKKVLKARFWSLRHGYVPFSCHRFNLWTLQHQHSRHRNGHSFAFCNLQWLFKKERTERVSEKEFSLCIQLMDVRMLFEKTSDFRLRKRPFLPLPYTNLWSCLVVRTQQDLWESQFQLGQALLLRLTISKVGVGDFVQETQ